MRLCGCTQPRALDILSRARDSIPSDSSLTYTPVLASSRAVRTSARRMRRSQRRLARSVRARALRPCSSSRTCSLIRSFIWTRCLLRPPSGCLRRSRNVVSCRSRGASATNWRFASQNEHSSPSLGLVVHRFLAHGEQARCCWARGAARHRHWGAAGTVLGCSVATISAPRADPVGAPSGIR